MEKSAEERIKVTEEKEKEMNKIQPITFVHMVRFRFKKDVVIKKKKCLRLFLEFKNPFYCAFVTL